MSITTVVAQGIIERHAVVVAAADPRLLVGDYTNDVRLLPDSVPVSEGRLAGSVAPTDAHSGSRR